jgi:hypothetical protein
LEKIESVTSLTQSPFKIVSNIIKSHKSIQKLNGGPTGTKNIQIFNGGPTGTKSIQFLNGGQVAQKLNEMSNLVAQGSLNLNDTDENIFHEISRLIFCIFQK